MQEFRSRFVDGKRKNDMRTRKTVTAQLSNQPLLQNNQKYLLPISAFIWFDFHSAYDGRCKAMSAMRDYISGMEFLLRMSHVPFFAFEPIKVSSVLFDSTSIRSAAISTSSTMEIYNGLNETCEK